MYNAVFFCFFSSDTEEKKAPGRDAPGIGFGGTGGRRLFPGKSPLPDPPEKRIWIKVLCAGRNCRFAVVSFLYANLCINAVFFCFFSSDTEEKKAPTREGDGKEGVILRQSLCKQQKRKPCLACVFLCCCDRMEMVNLNFLDKN